MRKHSLEVGHSDYRKESFHSELGLQSLLEIEGENLASTSASSPSPTQPVGVLLPLETGVLKPVRKFGRQESPLSRDAFLAGRAKEKESEKMKSGDVSQGMDKSPTACQTVSGVEIQHKSTSRKCPDIKSQFVDLSLRSPSTPTSSITKPKTSQPVVTRPSPITPESKLSVTPLIPSPLTTSLLSGTKTTDLKTSQTGEDRQSCDTRSLSKVAQTTGVTKTQTSNNFVRISDKDYHEAQTPEMAKAQTYNNLSNYSVNDIQKDETELEANKDVEQEPKKTQSTLKSGLQCSGLAKASLIADRISVTASTVEVSRISKGPQNGGNLKWTATVTHETHGRTTDMRLRQGLPPSKGVASPFPPQVQSPVLSKLRQETGNCYRSMLDWEDKLLEVVEEHSPSPTPSPTGTTPSLLELPTETAQATTSANDAGLIAAGKTDKDDNKGITQEVARKDKKAIKSEVEAQVSTQGKTKVSEGTRSNSKVPSLSPTVAYEKKRKE